MNFLNNYIEDVVLDELDDAAALALPDGTYRLTLSDSRTEPTRWEIVQAVVVSGVAALTRNLEGTARQSWPAGSVIYCDVTAGVLEEIETRIRALEDAGGGGGGDGPGPWVTLEPYPGSGWANYPGLAPYPPQARIDGDMLEFCGAMFFGSESSGLNVFELPPALRPVVSSDPGRAVELILPLVAAHPSDGTATAFAKLASSESSSLVWLDSVAASAVVSLDGVRIRRVWP